MAEEWRDVPGWDGYMVSDQGRVASILDGHTEKTTGYRQVTLGGRRRKKTFRLHSLVLQTFVGPRPHGCGGLHNNGDPGDNRLANLRWGTQGENLRDAVRHGTHHNAKKTHCAKANHPLEGDNLYVNPTSGGRQCKQCLRDGYHNRKGRV